MNQTTREITLDSTVRTSNQLFYPDRTTPGEEQLSSKPEQQESSRPVVPFPTRGPASTTSPLKHAVYLLSPSDRSSETTTARLRGTQQEALKTSRSLLRQSNCSISAQRARDLASLLLRWVGRGLPIFLEIWGPAEHSREQQAEHNR